MAKIVRKQQVNSNYSSKEYIMCEIRRWLHGDGWINSGIQIGLLTCCISIHIFVEKINKRTHCQSNTSSLEESNPVKGFSSIALSYCFPAPRKTPPHP